MKTMVLNIPDSVELEKSEVLMILASKLFEAGRLSMGQAADLAGISKRTFMELVGQYGVSIFNYSPEELDRDIQNATGHHI